MGYEFTRIIGRAWMRAWSENEGPSIWARYYAIVITDALSEIDTLEGFKDFFEWCKVYLRLQDFYMPSFDQLPDRCKHFARLLALEGEWPIV